MSQNQFKLRASCRYPLLLTLLFCMSIVGHAQGGGGAGVDSTGTGGRHSISGRIMFPSGQRADSRLKVRLESSGNGDLNVLADGNGTFMFRGLTAGSYTVVVEGGDYFETARETLYIEPTLTDPRSNVAIGRASYDRPGGTLALGDERRWCAQRGSRGSVAGAARPRDAGVARAGALLRVLPAAVRAEGNPPPAHPSRPPAT